MSTDYIRIYLAERETGYAIPIRDKLAKIASIPCSGPVAWEDIVELSHEPGQGPTLPTITNVILPSGLATTVLQYDTPSQGYQLMNLFSLLQGLGEGIFQPENGKPGLLAVAHPQGIDAVRLATAIGIPQPLAGKTLVEKLKTRWPAGIPADKVMHGPPAGADLSPAPGPGENPTIPQPENRPIVSEQSVEPNDAAEPSGEDLAALLQAEMTKAGIRAEVSSGGEFLSFDGAEELLAFVAVVTRGGPGDLYWEVMNHHPDHDFMDFSWSYFVCPSEQNYELVETSGGKRWCRVLTLYLSVCIPKKLSQNRLVTKFA